MSSQSGIPGSVGCGSVYFPSNGDEFIPVDFLEGCMDLRVVLPSKRIVRMSVERKTPMMDLLVQLTASHKISPGGHVIQVMNGRSDDFLYYKPSTPIGALDATTIHIIPKHKVSDSIVRKVPMKMLNKPFETTFRLQVRLPRNQLYVLRVSPKMTIAEVLQKVCEDKSLDETKYEVRDPDHQDERLHPDCSLSDYQLTEVALTHVGRSSQASRSVSTGDIMRLQQEAEMLAREAMVAHRNMTRTTAAKTKSSAGNSSLSSDSAGDRSISPGAEVVASPGPASASTTPASSGHRKSRPRSSSSTVSSGDTTTTMTTMPQPQARKKRPAPAPPPPSSGSSQQGLDSISVIESDARPNPKSTSMLNLSSSSHHDAPRNGNNISSNLSTISSGSTQSLASNSGINGGKRGSVGGGGKRRAPAPPPAAPTSPAAAATSSSSSSSHQPVSIIQEETPSLVLKEEEGNEAKGGKRLLPQVPQPSPAAAAATTATPSPAPRTSLTGTQDPVGPPPKSEPIYGKVDLAKKKKKKNRDGQSPAKKDDDAPAEKTASTSLEGESTPKKEKEKKKKKTTQKEKVSTQGVGMAEKQSYSGEEKEKQEERVTNFSASPDAQKDVEDDEEFVPPPVAIEPIVTIREPHQRREEEKETEEEEIAVAVDVVLAKDARKVVDRPPGGGTNDKNEKVSKKRTKKRQSKSTKKTQDISNAAPHDDEGKELRESTAQKLIEGEQLSPSKHQADQEFAPEEGSSKSDDRSQKSKPPSKPPRNGSISGISMSISTRADEDETDETNTTLLPADVNNLQVAADISNGYKSDPSFPVPNRSDASPTFAASAGGEGQVQASADSIEKGEHRPVVQHVQVDPATRPLSTNDGKDIVTPVIMKEKSIEKDNATSKPMMNPLASAAASNKGQKPESNVDPSIALGARPKVTLNNRIYKNAKQVANNNDPGKNATVAETKSEEVANNSFQKKLVKQDAIRDDDSKPDAPPVKVTLNKRFSKNESEDKKTPAIKRSESVDNKPQDSLPNFRMAPVANIVAPMADTKRKSKKSKDKQLKTMVDGKGVRTFIDEDVDSDDDLNISPNPIVIVANNDDDDGEDHYLIDSYSLFAMEPLKPKKQVKKANPAAIHGLTPEEEKRLEESKKQEETRKQEEEQEKQDRVRRANEEREAKRAETLKKIDMSRQDKIKVAMDTRARAIKSEQQHLASTENDLRHQLSSQLKDDETGEHRLSRVVPNTVALEIDDQDELLPVRRQRGDVDSTSSSSDEDGDETAAIAPSGSAMGQFTNSGSALASQYRTGLETGVTDYFNDEDEVYEVKDVQSLKSRDQNNRSKEADETDAAEPISITSLASVKSRDEAISQALDESFATIDIDQHRQRHSSESESSSSGDETEDVTVDSFGGKPTSVDEDTEKNDHGDDWGLHDADVPAPPSGFKDLPEDRPVESKTRILHIVDTSSSDEEKKERKQPTPATESVRKIKGDKQASQSPKVTEASDRTSVSRTSEAKKKEAKKQEESSPPSVQIIESVVAHESEKVTAPESYSYQKSSSQQSPQLPSDAGAVDKKEKIKVPVNPGPMQFSIDSYDSREKKEVPYNQKLAMSDLLASEKAKFRVEDEQEYRDSENDTVGDTIIAQPTTSSQEVFDPEPVPPLLHTKENPPPRELPPTSKVAATTKPEVPKDKPIAFAPSANTAAALEEDAARRASLTHVIGSNVPWIVRKTTLESNRIVPNDDLALNLRRKQSFGKQTLPPSAAASQITEPTMDLKISSGMTKASSVGNLSNVGMQVVAKEIDIHGKAEPAKIVPSLSVQETFAAIKKEIMAKQEKSNQEIRSNSISRPFSPQRNNVFAGRSEERVVTSPTVREALQKFDKPLQDIIIEEKRSSSPSSSPSRDSPPSSLSSVASHRHSPSPSGFDNSYKRQSPIPPAAQKSVARTTPPFTGDGPPSINMGIWKNRIGNSNGDVDRPTSAVSPCYATVYDGVHAPTSKLSLQSKWEVPAATSSATGKPGRFDPTVMVAKPWKRPNQPQLSNGHIQDAQRQSPLVFAPKMVDIVPAIAANSKSSTVSPVEDKKPQFYFGQNGGNIGNGGVSKRWENKQQTAIEKVRNNEAVSHPKNILVKPGYKVKDYVDSAAQSGKPSFTYGDSLHSKPKDFKPAVPPKPEAENSRFAPPSAFEPEYKVPRPSTSSNSGNGSSGSNSGNNSLRSQPRENNQADIRRQFEEQLLAGKSKLRAYETGIKDDSADSGISIHSPPPPPPPPVQFGNSDDSVVSYLARVNGQSAAPTVRRVGAAAPKTQGAKSTGTDDRSDLMSAIRGARGVQSLRKVSSGMNL